LLAFILLANNDDRENHNLMFNDPTMMFYMMIGVYNLVKGKPIVATCFVTVALSIKAGVILLLPAFLGSI